MTIFVGGPRHGTVYAPGSTVPPPPSYVDVTTGDQYTLLPVAFQVPNALTGKPDASWQNTVYLHAGLSGDPNQGMVALQDAVTRWWFTTHGTRRATPPGSNGHAPAAVVAGFAAECEPCQARHLFVTAGERAVWIRQHIDTTGHPVTYTDLSREDTK